MRCLQTSPESPGIYLLLQRVFRGQPLESLKSAAEGNGVSADQFQVRECVCVHVCVRACVHACVMCVCGWLGGWLMEAADCIQLYKNPVCVVCV